MYIQSMAAFLLQQQRLSRRHSPQTIDALAFTEKVCGPRRRVQHKDNEGTATDGIYFPAVR